MRTAARVRDPAPLRAAPRPIPEAKKNARLWWSVHQWVGLKLSLFMTFILLTGTLAVVSHEIDWLVQPSLRVAPSTVEGPIAWNAIVENANAHADGGTVEAIEAPIASAFAAKVTMSQPDGTYFYLHAHPTTGAIQGTGPWAGAQRVLRNMHRHLNMPTAIGVPIVSTLGFLLLVSLVTSLVVYKKWWRGFGKPLRSRDARTWWGDFHRLAGVWSLWFVALIGLTGVWYFVESVGLSAPPQPSLEEDYDPPAGAAPDLSAAFAAADAAYPGLKVRRVILPGEESPALELHGDYQAVLVRPRSNAVLVDPATAQVLLTRDGRDLDIHQRVSEMADPLHFGDFGGYWTKVPWFLFGLALTALSVSGAAIYSLRIARERGGHVRIARAFAGMWHGMQRWRWVSVVLMAIGFALLPVLVLQLA